MVTIHGIDGSETGEMDLPEVFQTPHRPELIKRAVHAYQSSRRQSYGTDPHAGQKTSAHYEGHRHEPPGVQMMERGMARLPRIHGDAPPHMRMRARLVSGTVKGRRPHGPKADKKWEKDMNDKERRLAIRSAVAATRNEELIRERNHRFDGDVPLVVSDDIQEISRTRELKNALTSLGLEDELSRVAERKIRAGKGKNRGRKYRTKKGPLIVIDDDNGIRQAASNIPGVDVVHVDTLNAENLSPGAHGARLTVWTELALETIGERYGD